ncbi:hypothetical protein AX768_27180 [Burkholderia sp. PAMC 28687]|uniref:Rha family transcriptional regulator n=1 Tax=Burkholderia sp. PAMC 28687 TaxID=1795874 RepID=UPI0007831BDB|nr:hypothetical protein AX768_27180 [Burkholderia sp. PAMC 28687]
MSSREIAERTGKAHPKVVGDIVRMFEQMGEVDQSAGFRRMVPIAIGSGAMREFLTYNLPKRECMILVSGESCATTT